MGPASGQKNIVLNYFCINSRNMNCAMAYVMVQLGDLYNLE